MHIRFNSSIAGHNFDFAPGDVAEWPDEKEAQRLVDRGIAEQLSETEAKKVAADGGRNIRKHRVIETAMRSQQGERAVTR